MLRYVTSQQPQMSMFSSFPEPLSNNTYLDWLTCQNGDVLSYHNTTKCWLLLRQCSGTALVYLWESLLDLGKKVSLLICFEASHWFPLSLKQKVVSHPGKVQKYVSALLWPGLDWLTLSGLELHLCTHSNPQPCIGTMTCVCWAYHNPVITILHSMTHMEEQSWIWFLVVKSCFWFLLLSTSSLVLTVILSSSWRVEVHFARYLMSTFLLWPSRKNVSEFDSPMYTLLNHLAVLWDQDFNNNCSIQNSRWQWSTLGKWPWCWFLDTSVLQILGRTGQCCRKGCTFMFEGFIQIH